MKALLERLLHYAFLIFHTKISARVIEEEEDEDTGIFNYFPKEVENSLSYFFAYHHWVFGSISKHESSRIFRAAALRLKILVQYPNKALCAYLNDYSRSILRLIEFLAATEWRNAW